MKTRIVITGGKGRMGLSIFHAACRDEEIEVIASVERGQVLRDFVSKGLVVIDFSSPSATPDFAQVAAETGCPMVIGTTGLNETERKAIVHASHVIPIVLAPNMSVGVNLLFALTRSATSVLGKEFDVEIVERHHRRKKDAPSGTALRIAEIVAEERKVELSTEMRCGRQGEVGERTSHEIGVHAVRGGDFVGEHTVIFAGDGEVVEVIHRASSREIFAKGALRAAKWVAHQKPGLYDMGSVLGL